MLLRGGLRAALRVRYSSTATSFQTAVISKDYASAEKLLPILVKEDLQQKELTKTLRASLRDFSVHAIKTKDQNSFQTLLAAERKLLELGDVRISAAKYVLEGAVEFDELDNGLGFWVSYLEALGSRTSKSMKSIVSQIDHRQLSLLALACYFKACAKAGAAVRLEDASSLVPLEVFPAVVGELYLSAENMRILEDGLRTLRSQRTDLGKESYIDILNEAVDKELNILYEEAAQRPDLSEKIWATFIRRFAETRQSDRAFEAWNRMVQSGVTPTIIGWNGLLRAAAITRENALESFRLLWDKMIKQGVVPNADSYAVKIATLHRNGNFAEALATFKDVKEHKMEAMDIFVVNNTLNALLDQNMFESGLSLLRWAESAGIKTTQVSYNTLLRDAVNGRDLSRVQKSLDAMIEADVKPGVITYSHVLQSHFKTAQQKRIDVSDKVEEIIKEMELNKIKPNKYFMTILADGIAKTTRNVGAVRKIYETIRQTNTRVQAPTFGAFIDAELNHGDVDRALRIFKQMRDYGIVAPSSTYTQIIGGALRRGQPAVALDMWNKLVNASGPKVAPTVWTYMFVLRQANKEMDSDYAKLLQAVLDRLQDKDRHLIDYRLALQILRLGEFWPVGSILQQAAENAKTSNYQVSIGSNSRQRS